MQAYLLFAASIVFFLAAGAPVGNGHRSESVAVKAGQEHIWCQCHCTISERSYSFSTCGLNPMCICYWLPRITRLQYIHMSRVGTRE